MDPKSVEDATIALIEQLLRDERWFSDTELSCDVVREQLLAVRVRGRTLYPAFQFAPTGQPHPGLSDLRAYLPTGAGGWSAALWCFGPTRKLGGARPADTFAVDPAAVIAAAKRDFVGDDRDW